jgi:DNA polymerase-4
MRTVGDLVALDVATLERAVGQALGRHLYALARGIDDRPVESERQIKSIGREETFAHDVVDRQVLHADLVRLADDVASRLRGHGLAARTVVLKVRFGDFETITRSHTPATPVTAAPALVRVIEPLLDGVPLHRGVRLIGISVNGLVPPTGQLSLLTDLDPELVTVEDVERAWAPASGAIDEIRHKFGTDAIGPGSSLVAPRRSTPWGPRRSDPVTDTEGPALP